MSEPLLLLVDGSSYLYRAYHALPPFSTKAGEPTGALLGVTRMLATLVNEFQPKYYAVVFDAKGKNFRHKLYEDYKATRPPMPDELRSQIDPLLEIIQAFGWPLLKVPGVEADDVLGTLATHAEQAGLKTIISTGDKDMAQLVTDKVSLINTMSRTSMDRDGVKEKFDVWPEQIIDYLALVGDTSDNIPGVPSVGPKTAAKWLNQYETVDELIKHADEINGKVGERLREHLDDVALSYELATIKKDVELSFDFDDLTLSDPDKNSLLALFERWELKSLVKVLNANNSTPRATVVMPAPKPKPAQPVTYSTITTQKELDAWCEKIEAAKAFAFDTETTSIAYMQAKLVGMSFSVKPYEAAYLPLGHDYEGAPKQLDRAKTLAKLKPILENPNIKKIGHHLKYDAHILKHEGIALNGIEFDSMLESFVVNSTATNHNLDAVAAYYLDVTTTKFADIAGKGKAQKTFNEIELEFAAPYAAEDADVSLRLHRHLSRVLRQTPSLKKVYHNIEKPLIPVLQGMEYRGVLVDEKKLKRQSKRFEKKLAELELAAHKLAGDEFNLSSTKQLGEILFEQQGLPVIRKTPKGAPSTAEDVLQELAADYELPKLILEHRSLSKLKSTYTDKLPLEMDAFTGRIHTSYHQAGAATGRLSSSNPNLQNIPIRTKEGRLIRQAFVPPAGYKLLAADYSQVELRIMAHLSGDEALLNAFKEDRDIHQATAADIFSVELEKVNKQQRRFAKIINFGLIYGMSEFGLAKQLDLDRYEARDYIERYFNQYPGVKDYMEEAKARAQQSGFVESVFGRRLYLQDINAKNARVRQYAERSAVNAPVQGSGADIIKLAMVSVQNWINEAKPDVNMIMQVHDELVFEVAEDKLDEHTQTIQALMTQAAELLVPLKVDVGVGDNWDEAH